MGGSQEIKNDGSWLTGERFSSLPFAGVEGSLAAEIAEVLRQAKVTVPAGTCEACAHAHVTEGKEAAANILRAAGVVVTRKVSKFSLCECGIWTVNGHTMFIG